MSQVGGKLGFVLFLFADLGFSRLVLVLFLFGLVLDHLDVTILQVGEQVVQLRQILFGFRINRQDIRGVQITLLFGALDQPLGRSRGFRLFERTRFGSLALAQLGGLHPGHCLLLVIVVVIMIVSRLCHAQPSSLISYDDANHLRLLIHK